MEGVVQVAVTLFNLLGDTVHRAALTVAPHPDLAAFITIAITAAAIAIPVSLAFTGLALAGLSAWQRSSKPTQPRSTATLTGTPPPAPAGLLSLCPCCRWRKGGAVAGTGAVKVLKVRRRGQKEWLRLTLDPATVTSFAGFVQRVRVKLATADVEEVSGVGADVPSDAVERVKITALYVGARPGGVAAGCERLDADTWTTLVPGDEVEVVEKGE